MLPSFFDVEAKEAFDFDLALWGGEFLVDVVVGLVHD